MGLAELLSSLERDAADRIDAVLEEARARARSVVAESDARIARRSAEATTRLAAELEAERQTRVASERRRASAELLEARARMLDRVFAAAEARLETLASSVAYQRSLVGQLAHALALSRGQTSIRCDPRLEPLISRTARELGSNAAVVPDASLGPGFAIDTLDGTSTVDGTLRGQLARQRQRCRIDVLRAWEAAR